jgi:putative transcriptional regulator
MIKSYRSQVMASIHETATGLHAAGVIDKSTIHTFDEACLTSDDIRALREHAVTATKDAAES